MGKVLGGGGWTKVDEEEMEGEVVEASAGSRAKIVDVGSILVRGSWGPRAEKASLYASAMQEAASGKSCRAQLAVKRGLNGRG